MSINIKVLMVDDEERFRTTTAKILERKGYETVMAASGEEALVKMSEKPDVVILDVKMEGMDGHETLKKIKEIDADVPVIMLTGHGALPSAKEALDSGATDYLNKPCDVDLLSAKIRDAVAAAKQEPYRERLAEEIMIPLTNYATITEDETVRSAIVKLKELGTQLVSTDRLMDTGHRSILVFDKTGDLTGILSPMDLIAAARPAYLSVPKPSMADSLQYSTMFWQGLFTSRIQEIADKKVADIMSDCPPVIDATANLMEIAETMFSQRARRLAVARGGKVVGVVREQEMFFEIGRIIAN
ncbi:CBS domain-containing protein [Paucidesulfovibrio longus]|uniref:CBS domain-containing protein n=1 Tax=Paucidesulfovibrio longus TaxID=889 RepID=UPI0003B3CC9E|nr:response regulator [Paucidesulfovibrio longus]